MSRILLVMWAIIITGLFGVLVFSAFTAKKDDSKQIILPSQAPAQNQNPLKNLGYFDIFANKGDTKKIGVRIYFTSSGMVKKVERPFGEKNKIKTIDIAEGSVRNRKGQAREVNLVVNAEIEGASESAYIHTFDYLKKNHGYKQIDLEKMFAKNTVWQVSVKTEKPEFVDNGQGLTAYQEMVLSLRDGYFDSLKAFIDSDMADNFDDYIFPYFFDIEKQ